MVRLALLFKLCIAVLAEAGHEKVGRGMVPLLPPKKFPVSFSKEMIIFA